MNQFTFHYLPSLLHFAISIFYTDFELSGLDLGFLLPEFTLLRCHWPLDLSFLVILLHLSPLFLSSKVLSNAELPNFHRHSLKCSFLFQKAFRFSFMKLISQKGKTPNTVCLLKILVYQES